MIDDSTLGGRGAVRNVKGASEEEAQVDIGGKSVYVTRTGGRYRSVGSPEL